MWHSLKSCSEWALYESDEDLTNYDSDNSDYNDDDDDALEQAFIAEISYLTLNCTCDSPNRTIYSEYSWLVDSVTI